MLSLSRQADSRGGVSTGAMLCGETTDVDLATRATEPLSMFGTRPSSPSNTAPGAPPTQKLRRTIGDITFSLATPHDDDAIRAFLATQSMRGPIRLRIQTEPSFFAAAALMGDHADILIARHTPTQRIVGLGVRAGLPARR